ncbi:hypothetical protein A2U01_0047733, partial [Trifolium medium]|nr:hypothetical protein [Trifolium medium]
EVDIILARISENSLVYQDEQVDLDDEVLISKPCVRPSGLSDSQEGHHQQCTIISGQARGMVQQTFLHGKMQQTLHII